MKCLYIIESLLLNKFEDIHKFFSENQQLFVEIQTNQNYNKKLVDVTNNILNILRDVESRTVKIETTSNVKSNKVNLLDLVRIRMIQDDEKPNNSIPNIDNTNFSKVESKKSTNNIDLLGFETINTNNSTSANISSGSKKFKFIKNDEKKEQNFDVLNAFSEGLSDTNPQNKNTNENTSKSSFKFIKQSNKYGPENTNINKLSTFDNLIDNVNKISPQVKKHESTPDVALLDLTKSK